MTEARRTPAADDLDLAALWLRNYEAGDDDAAAGSMALVAQWLDEQARKLRDRETVRQVQAEVEAATGRRPSVAQVRRVLTELRR